MSSDTWVAILGSAAVTTILGAIVQGYFNRKKLGAEATEIITRAASGVVERLEAEIAQKVSNYSTLEAKYNALVSSMENMKQAYSAERDSVRRVLQLHVAWDAMVKAKCAEAGIDLPPVPPLMPPERADLH